MKILLIRHGESEADLLKVHEGRADYPLTLKGIEQAQLMANRVKAAYTIDKIWASTLQRAKKTAEILSETINCSINYLDELKERDNGDLAGKAYENVKMPIKLLPHEKLGIYGESKIEFRMRAEQVFSSILKQSEGCEQIAIVSHGGTISKIIESFLQLPVVHNCMFVTGDTGIHLVEINKQGRIIHFTNSTSHLSK
ncbi:histidine phosphatase family protein [Rummeliibacillus pycnus]|uniref:histidine phosphatase family protein n=1 Tax=Rummeliibacillus pycnus TaxID=101070 RepID=UPI000C9CDD29|nr:histidine phosphatase family protein [Rummeliibacillus pycnus]